MKLLFMGTGTSVGVPMIGCHCAVCESTDPRNRRRRSSICLESDGFQLMVDTPPDFREQALQFRLPRVDAVVFTHSHADHVFGFDDLRRFNTIQGGEIPVFGSAATIRDLKRVFDYVASGEDVEGTYRPRIRFHDIHGAFRQGPFEIIPLEVEHGPKPTHGYLFRAGGKTAGYVPDCHVLPPSAIQALQGVDVMILDGLRHKPHSTHLTVADSVRLLQEVGAKQSFLTHMCHDVEHESTERTLPPGIRLAYDGLVLDW